MNSVKIMSKGLKWVFSFFATLTGIATIGVLLVMVVLRVPSVIYQVQAIDTTELPFGQNTLAFISSPLFGGLLIANFALFGTLCCSARSFFKNLEKGQIFINQNVQLARRIAMILVSLMLVACLSSIHAVACGISFDALSLDISYVFTAAIIWVLAGILEQSIRFAKSSKVTI